MALRLIIASALAGFSMLAGRAFAGARLREADDIRALMDDFQLLRVLTLERLLPMGSALSEMRYPALRMTGETMRQNGDMSLSDAWAFVRARESARGGALEFLSGEDADEVSALFSALGAMGRRDHEGQYAQSILRLGRREEESRRAGKEKVKLYASLGALAGLAMGIMLV